MQRKRDAALFDYLEDRSWAQLRYFYAMLGCQSIGDIRHSRNLRGAIYIHAQREGVTVETLHRLLNTISDTMHQPNPWQRSMKRMRARLQR